MVPAEVTTDFPGKDPLTASLDAIPLAILLIDNTSKIRWANGKGETLFGCRRKSLIGQSIEPGPGGLWTWSNGLGGAVWTHLREGDPIRGEEQHVIILADGTRREHRLRVTTSPIPYAGAQTILMALEDMARPEKSERRNTEAEALSRTIQMARAIAHELSQPLSVLVGNLELFRKQLTVNDTLTNRIEKISESADRVAEIVHRLHRILHSPGKRDRSGVRSCSLHPPRGILPHGSSPPHTVSGSPLSYHLRGNTLAAIFLDDEDHERFFAVLEDVIKDSRWVCYAYCLMVNHYHLLIKTPEGSLSSGMRQTNGVYTHPSTPISRIIKRSRALQRVIRMVVQRTRPDPIIFGGSISESKGEAHRQERPGRRSW